MQKILLALVVVLSGCAHSGEFERLSKDDQDATNRCFSTYVRQSVCTSGNRNGSVTELGCLSSLSDEYFATRNKKKWLVEHGCPRDVAGYNPPQQVHVINQGAQKSNPEKSQIKKLKIEILECEEKIEELNASALPDGTNPEQAAIDVCQKTIKLNKKKIEILSDDED